MDGVKRERWPIDEFYEYIRQVFNRANLALRFTMPRDPLHLGVLIVRLDIYRQMEALKCQESQ
jgi:hypothetical protein